MTPTVRNCLDSAAIRSAGSDAIRPIKNEPMMFTVSVPHGNAGAARAVMNVVNQCRATPPRPLPNAMSKYAFTGTF